MSKILIAEDDEVLISAINIGLNKETFKTEIIQNGDEVLEKAKEFKPNVILLDLMLPGKNGEDVLKELKKDKETKHIPILILSVKSSDEDVDRCLKLGAKEYIIKVNYSIEDLIKKIQKELK